VLTARARRLRFRRLVFALLAHRAVLDCSLRSLRIALGSRLLRRRSTTKNPSAHSSSARRRAIRRWIARSARCGSRWEAAYFVIAQRRKARRLTPPQHGGVRSAVGLLAPLAVHRAGRPPTSSSLNDEKRVGSFLLNTARRWGWCSLRSRVYWRHAGARSAIDCSLPRSDVR
jgi:hypothetical protein